jgi:hypothetical protein
MPGSAGSGSEQGRHVSGSRPGGARIGMRVRMQVTRAGEADLPCFRPEGPEEAEGPAGPAGEA